MGQLKKENGEIHIRDDTGAWRYIGKVDQGNNALVIYREKSKHLHRNTNSYGISRAAIERGWFEYVILNERTPTALNVYVIPVDELKTMPTYKAKAFEEQIMINLDILKQYDLGKWKK